MKAAIKILLLSVFFFPFTLRAQTGSLKLTVREIIAKGRAQPSDSALVRLIKGDSVLYRKYSINGNCLIDSIKPGRYELYVKKPMRETVVISTIKIEEGRCLFQPVMLGGLMKKEEKVKKPKEAKK